MMKKFLAIAVLTVFIASCGGSSSNESTDINTDTTGTSINATRPASDGAGAGNESTNAGDSANKMVNQAAGKMKKASDNLKDSNK